jgi:putative flippase GtrA
MKSTKADLAGGSPLHKLTAFQRSLLTSLFTTALDFGTLVGLTEIAGIDYVVSTWIGTVVGSLSNFAINKRWAFSARAAPMGPALWRFALVQLAASGLHTAGVWALTRFGGLVYLVSKLVVAAVVYLGWNYPLNRWFVFHPRHQAVATADPTQS